MQTGGNQMTQFGEKDVRLQLSEALSRFGYKQVDVSKETGIHHSSLSLWLQGKIRGHQIGIEEIIEQWLHNLYANKPRFSESSSSKFSRLKNQKEMAQMHHSNQNIQDKIIPVRIDLEMESRRYKDTIFWNLSEQQFTPEIFAKLVSEENSLTPNFEAEIAAAIRQQITARQHLNFNANTENIRVIEIDVRIDNVCMKDHFEWDISNPDNCPEDFAILLCNEMGLNSEFAAQIAYQIRDQIFYYQKLLDDHKDTSYSIILLFKRRLYKQLYL